MGESVNYTTWHENPRVRTWVQQVSVFRLGAHNPGLLPRQRPLLPVDATAELGVVGRQVLRDAELLDPRPEGRGSESQQKVLVRGEVGPEPRELKVRAVPEVVVRARAEQDYRVVEVVVCERAQRAADAERLPEEDVRDTAVVPFGADEEEADAVPRVPVAAVIPREHAVWEHREGVDYFGALRLRD